MAEMEAHNQSDLTQRQRAEELLVKLGIYAWPYRIEHVLEFYQQTRQEALREASKIVNDYNCMHNHGKKATKACDDIFEQLDRLAREGVKE